MDLIEWAFRLSSRREGDWVNGVDERIRYFSPLREHENLLLHPSNKNQLLDRCYIVKAM